MIAGDAEPNCIMMAGEPFGTTPHTRFSDAFALSWTTFATVVSWFRIYVCWSSGVNTKHSLNCSTSRMTGLWHDIYVRRVQPW
jgi:hypothetical protein